MAVVSGGLTAAEFRDLAASFGDYIDPLSGGAPARNDGAPTGALLRPYAQAAMASGKPLLLSKGVWDLSDWTTLDTTGALRIIGGGASRDDVVVRGAGDRSGVGINALHSLSLENLTLQDWNKPWRLTPGSQTADIDLVRLNRIYFKDCIYWGYLQHNGVASNQRLSAVEMDWIDGDCAGIADEAQTWGMWLYGQIGRGVFDHIYGRDLNGTGLWVGAEDKAANLRPS